MTALIRYQVFPEVVRPAQVTVQLPPLTVETTDTCLPLSMTAIRLEATDGLVRRATSSHDAAWTDAPSAMLGDDSAATVDRTVADSIATMTMATKDRRSGRRARECTGDTSAWGPQASPSQPVRSITPWGQRRPAPSGQSIVASRCSNSHTGRIAVASLRRVSLHPAAA